MGKKQSLTTDTANALDSDGANATNNLTAEDFVGGLLVDQQIIPENADDTGKACIVDESDKEFFVP